MLVDENFINNDISGELPSVKPNSLPCFNKQLEVASNHNKNNDKCFVLAVVGPTASGKTKLSIELAKRFNGEIVSADSMQIYKCMDIGTAKPTIDEMCGIPHHLINFLDVSSEFSVAEYVNLAHKCIEEIIKKGKIPIICGGTGLYVRSLLDDIKFQENKSSECIRRELEEKANNEGVQSLLDELTRFDPESAKKLHPNNLKRIIRAIEIYRMTGITLTKQQELSTLKPTRYNSCVIGLDFRDRSNLYDRINKRVEQMFASGLLEEAEKILDLPLSKTAGGAIAYKELSGFFSGYITPEEAEETLKIKTRRYAKRQLTWFHKDRNINWIYVDDYSDFSGLLNCAEKIAAHNINNY